ncbi:MAG: PLP-dependent aspartate aminotransferase family protein [Deltaproteobacteria bacterium]
MEIREIETLLAHAGTHWDDRTGAVSMPVYQTSTFKHPALGQSTGFDYSRSGNPNRQVLEELMASVEGGARGLAFSSGMAAIDCLMRLFKPGDELIVSEDPYGGTFRLFEKVYRPLGIKAVYADTSQRDAVEGAITEHTRAVFIESPTNPMLRVADIPSLCELASVKGILSIVDNTFLTPYFQRPIELGADIVLYSATKYLSGHNDVLLGLIITKDKKPGEELYFYQNSVGAVPGPWDCWLTLRGLKTLPLRLKRQEENAIKIARWLTTQKRVKKVYYPGLAGHPGHKVLEKQSSGFGAMISFEVDDPEIVPKMLSRVKVFLFAESLGGVESLITYPAVQTHADMDENIREQLGINDKLIRLSIGVENIDDLIDDLTFAMEA